MQFFFSIDRKFFGVSRSEEDGPLFTELRLRKLFRGEGKILIVIHLCLERKSTLEWTLRLYKDVARRNRTFLSYVSATKVLQ